jgi:hypothetical protein
MNVEWHRANPMPRKATDRQRAEWHQAHQRYCACRPVPARIRQLIERATAAGPDEQLVAPQSDHRIESHGAADGQPGRDDRDTE